jgi:uncharacterized protein (TIGR03437 family)
MNRLPPLRSLLFFRFYILATLAMSILGPPTLFAAIQLRTVATGLASPVYVTGARDGSGRLFIIEQAGRIRVLANNGLLPTAFLDIRSRVRSGGEMGLLGLAFHPQYRDNGRFFVNYTRQTAGGLETVISEFTASPSNSNVALAESERILLTFPQPFENHNGGMLAFGPDGYFYIGTGDGGSGGDPLGNGQNLTSLLGKILRIDVDSATPYGIPPSNPFAASPGLDEIYAYGLRNPWRFSFDPASGRMFVGDVGQDAREEIDIVTAGNNYGWNRMEGTRCFSPSSNCDSEGLTPPIHDYGRSLGGSVTGGYVYRGGSAPSLVGKYIYADFISGRIWALSEISAGAWRNEELMDAPFNISSFGEDDNGELYVVDFAGSVRQITTDGREPLLNARSAVNAASFIFGPVAPGQIVSLFGTGLGPPQAAGAALDEEGRLARVLGGTRVWFDEFAAPLFYAEQTQLNAQVPYGVAGRRQVMVQVEYQGALSNPILLDVAEAAPGLFTISGGVGPGAILNSDSSLNSASRPAVRGSEIVLYATGGGLTNPAAVDGQLAGSPSPSPILPVVVRIGGIRAELRFSGLAPGFAGLLQVNVIVPTNAPTGSTVPLELSVGGTSAQIGVTVAVN